MTVADGTERLGLTLASSLEGELVRAPHSLLAPDRALPADRRLRACRAYHPGVSLPSNHR